MSLLQNRATKKKTAQEVSGAVFLRPAPRVGTLGENGIHYIHVNKGRYSAQALLDEAAVFSCMVYVDLNPVRAKITEKLEESNNTSIKKRLEEINQINPVDAQEKLDTAISAISNQISSKKLPLSLKSYSNYSA